MEKELREFTCLVNHPSLWKFAHENSWNTNASTRVGTMLPRMLMPDWLPLFLLTLPQTFCALAATLNVSQHFHQFRGAIRTSKPPPPPVTTTTMTSSGRQFFFADVNTKINAKVGTKAELPCLVYGIDLTNVVISWWKAGEYQELSLGLETRQHRYYLPRKFYEDWTLVIDNIQETDAGFYACQINADSLLEKIFLLNVTSDGLKSTDQEFLKDEGFYQKRERNASLNQSNSTSGATFRTPISLLLMSFIVTLAQMLHPPLSNAPI
ncbi:hypothetical protein TcWFU_004881 [Taenia crassiceps]|uniref:Ig-like domain-containing protein n=1 Tax=Taenia crassiceps TaxID=6207 RepID=A0ABR4Q923_9CEST